jgi:tRNA(Ile)-lysidine synthase
MPSRVEDPLKTVKDFIEKRWDGVSPLLLGYSGGPDSKALLYALLEVKGLPLHVAHVDHAWRESSREEAALLKEEAADLCLPFHTTRFPPPEGGNLEEKGRQGRLCFFQSLFQAIPFQALLLGHQADDAAETALQRVLGGAHLPFLGGIAEKTLLEGMEIWRPLLQIEKKTLLQFLKAKGLVPFLDGSNLDRRFLRGRLRTELLPTLASQFGKGIHRNLRLLGERAFELQEYLERRTALGWEGRKTGDWGVLLELSSWERIEGRFLLQKMASYEGFTITRAVLEKLLEALLLKRSSLRFEVQGRVFWAHEGICVLLSNSFNHLKIREIKTLLRQYSLFLL